MCNGIKGGYYDTLLLITMAKRMIGNSVSQLKKILSLVGGCDLSKEAQWITLRKKEGKDTRSNSILCYLDGLVNDV